MLGKGYGGLYKPQKRKKEESEMERGWRDFVRLEWSIRQMALD